VIKFSIFTAKVDDKMQHRKVKSIGILVHSDETQFYICSADEKVHENIVEFIETTTKKKKKINIKSSH